MTKSIIFSFTNIDLKLSINWVATQCNTSPISFQFVLTTELTSTKMIAGSNKKNDHSGILYSKSILGIIDSQQS